LTSATERDPPVKRRTRKSSEGGTSGSTVGTPARAESGSDGGRTPALPPGNGEIEVWPEPPDQHQEQPKPDLWNCTTIPVCSRRRPAGVRVMHEPSERRARGDPPVGSSTTSTSIGLMPVGASVVNTTAVHPGLRLTDEVLTGLCAVSEAVEAGLEASVGAFLMLADACLRSGDLAARDGVLARAVSWISASADSPENGIRDLSAACVCVGRAAEAIGRPALARHAYTTAIERASAATDPDIVAILWREIGDTWRAERDAEQARSAYRAAAALDDSGGLAQDVLAKLAEVERRWGTPEEAERAFSEALAILDQRQQSRKLDPQKVAAEALQLGQAAMSLGLPRLARESYVLGRDQLGPTADPNLLGALSHEIEVACSAAEEDSVHVLAKEPGQAADAGATP
jgi:hypothetical protein